MTAIVVTGLGLNTPVGNNAAQTCAALRARISRLRAWPGFAYGGEQVVAGALREDSKEGPWVIRAVDMVLPTLYEALWQAQLYDHTAHEDLRVGLFLATPPADRPEIGPADHRDFVEHVQDVWSDLAQNEAVQIVDREQVGGALAIAAACEALTHGTLDAAVVAGVESQLHGQHLEQLLGEGRLHIAGRPNGIVPGEAACALVLETTVGARKRRVAPLARIAALALESEAEDWSPRRPSEAAALTRALQTALVAAGAPVIDRVIVDHSGERWRFRDWALAEVRALRGLPDDWQLWHPGDNVGDIGAAFIGLAVGMAATAFARGYGGRGSILLAASNHSGERAALVVSPPQGGSP